MGRILHPLASTLLLIPFLLLSCKKGDPLDIARLLTFLQPQQTINAQSGGTIGSLPEVQLSVPANALETDTSITISRMALPPAQEGIIPFQASYSFGPEDLQFLVPATMDICYDPSQLAAQNLNEDSVQIYYHNPQTGELTSVGGDVDTSAHCVSAPVHHFSTYLAAAIALSPGNNPPVIGGATFLPSTPLIGIPLRVSSTITDFDGGGTGALSAVFLYYRFGGSGAFTKVAMQSDPLSTNGQFYSYTIPGNQVVAGNLQYYIQAKDNFNATRNRPTTAPATPSSIAITATLDIATPLRITPTTSPFQMAAGFNRVFTTQARRSNGTYYNITPESYSVAGGIGPASLTTPSTLQFQAQTSGTGSLSFSAGIYSTNKTISVSPGQIQSISILDNMGVAITSPVNIKAGTTYSFDVVGSDAYGNTVPVLASVALDSATLGTITTDASFTASTTYPQTGTLTATLGSFSATATINITSPLPAAAAPDFSPPPGSYDSDQTIALTTTTPGATIYYTTDGSTPTTASAVYSGPISVAGSGTNIAVNAISVAAGYQDSVISTGNYSITYLPVATPVFSPSPGSYPNTQLITITTSTPGATIYYTTDGSTPTIWSQTYTGPITMTMPATMFNAIAVKTGMLNSTMASSVYVMKLPPTLSYAGLPYSFTRDSSIGTITPALTGGPLSDCTSNPPLPPGLVVSPTTCSISGTPTAAQPATIYTISATNANGIGDTNISIAVLKPLPWARTATAGWDSFFHSTAVDSAGNVYAAGMIWGNGTFTFGPGITATGKSTGGNIILVKYNSSGIALWARTVVASSGDSLFNSVAVDAYGNIHAAGIITSGVYDFGSGVSLIGAGGSLLVKYDPSGTPVWARTSSGSNGTPIFGSVAVDASGNIYAAGIIDGDGSATYDFGSGIMVTGGGGGFLVKYDSSGTPQWARTASGGSNTLTGVAVDSSGWVYVAGNLSSTGTSTFGPGITATGISTYNTAFLAKYSPTGTATWVRAVSSGTSSIFTSVAADTSGAVYAAGYITKTGAYTFGPGVTASGPGTIASSVLVKYDSSGTAQWASTVSTGSTSSAFNSLAVDTVGNIYAAGYFQGTDTYTFAPGIAVTGLTNGNSVVLVKYSSSGTAILAQSVSSGTNSQFRSIAVDPARSVYAVGTIGGSGTYDFGSGVTATGISPSGNTGVLVKYVQ